MTDLTEFLLARLAEDQQHAEKDIWAADQATPGDWHARCGHNLPNSWVECETSPIARLDGVRHQADALLVSRFKPDTVRARARRVLAECEAKRRILKEHAPIGGGCRRCASWEDSEGDNPDCDEVPATAIPPAAWFPCVTVRLLALPYADHPDYREEWRP